MFKMLRFPVLMMFLLSYSATVAKVSAEDPALGVKTGDWTKYSVSTTGSPPSDYSNTTWEMVEFLSVNGTRIVAQMMFHYRDGTERNDTAIGDVVEQRAIFDWLILPDSEVGDQVYVFGFGTTIVGETSKTYAGARRAVLFATATRLGQNHTYYWDKKTGILVEGVSDCLTWTMNAVVVETNMWSGGFLGLDLWSWVIIIIVVLAVGTVAGLAIRKQSLWSRKSPDLDRSV